MRSDTCTTLVSQFSYDAFGRRVQIIEQSNGTTTSNKRYLWCAGQICEERDVLNNYAVTKRFYPEGQINYQPSTVNLFYTRDHLGSIREMTDSSGAVRARYDYTPYGLRSRTTGDLDSDFGFTGHWFHSPSSLHLAWFRAYDADAARWLSRDPIAEGEGPNLYGYVHNNPFIFVDRLGLDQRIFNPNYGHEVFGQTGPQPLFITVVTTNPQWLDDIVDALAFPGTGMVGGEFEGAAMQALNDEAESLLARLMALARKLYPKKCGKIELHHIDPKYMGGDPNGPKIPLEAPYHQLITNGFREAWPYGQDPPPSNLKANIVAAVYAKYPLPKY